MTVVLVQEDGVLGCIFILSIKVLHQTASDCLEDRWQNLANALSQAVKGALDVLVIVFQQLVQLVEELYMLLHGENPPEVHVKQEQDCHDAFASDYDVLVVEQFLQCNEELLFL